MDTKIGQRWVKALRGETKVKYKQGRGHLRQHIKGKRHDRFCCLGVLCEIMNVPSTPGYSFYSYQGHAETLPRSVQKKAGLDLKTISILIRANDSGTSFKRIARYIEKHLIEGN